MANIIGTRRFNFLFDSEKITNSKSKAPRAIAVFVCNTKRINAANSDTLRLLPLNSTYRAKHNK